MSSSMSLIDNNNGGSGVGHYKGVMLCNRPFGGTMVTQKTQNTSEKTSFSCGVVPVTVGVNVPIPMKEKMLKRPKKDSVLVKHKKWLSDLQKTKERFEEQYLEDLQRKEDSKQKFQEHEKRMRELSRTILKPGDSDTKGDVDSKADAKNPETSSSPVGDGAKDLRSDAKEYKKTFSQFKPAWALTENKADSAAEAKKELEDDELLEFANSLNYDKYIADLEVKTMMDRLRKRIEELEKEVAAEDAREADAEVRAAKREMLELMGNAEKSLQQEERNENSEALTAAKALLDEDEEMQAVHSTKSVVQLLQKAKDKINTVRASVKPPSGVELEQKILNEPKIVVHEPNEGARLDGKNLVSNLPYMHRNPAV